MTNEEAIESLKFQMFLAKKDTEYCPNERGVAALAMAIKALEQQPITWIIGKDNAQVAVRNMSIDKMQKICVIIGEIEQQPKTIQEKQVESEKHED